MPKKEGSGPAQVADQRPVAFLPQQPWIFNSTVRQNVLFGEAFSEARRPFGARFRADLEPKVRLLGGGSQFERRLEGG